MPRQTFGALSGVPQKQPPAPPAPKPTEEAEVAPEPEPREPTPKELALPSGVQGAPVVSDLAVSTTPQGALLTWQGTPSVSWEVNKTKGGVLGYNVYRAKSTSWVLVAVDAYPPHLVEDAVPGDVLGVAPVYGMADGSVIGGGIVSVTVGR